MYLVVELFSSKLPDFLNDLPPDLGFRGNELRTINVYRFIDSLNLPSDGLHVHYLDVMYRLCWNVFRVQVRSCPRPLMLFMISNIFFE